jgi:hypothetical protein
MQVNCDFFLGNFSPSTISVLSFSIEHSHEYDRESILKNLSCVPLFRKNIDRRREKFGYESVSNMGLSVAGADVFQVHTLIKKKTKFPRI